MKDERSSFWARAAHSACALKHGLLTSTGTLVDAGARGPAYDKERAERLSAAAVQVATDFAAGFK